MKYCSEKYSLVATAFNPERSLAMKVWGSVSAGAT